MNYEKFCWIWITKQILSIPVTSKPKNLLPEPSVQDRFVLCWHFCSDHTDDLADFYKSKFYFSVSAGKHAVRVWVWETRVHDECRVGERTLHRGALCRQVWRRAQRVSRQNRNLHQLLYSQVQRVQRCAQPHPHATRCESLRFKPCSDKVSAKASRRLTLSNVSRINFQMKQPTSWQRVSRIKWCHDATFSIRETMRTLVLLTLTLCLNSTVEILQRWNRRRR